MRRVVVAAVGAVFLLTAFLKAWTPGPTQRVVQHLIVVVTGAGAGEPAVVSAARAAPAALIVVEIAIGCALMTGWRARLAPRIAIGVLLVFSAMLVALLADPSAPGCGCAGAVRLAESARAENLLGLGRNALLIAASLWATPRPSAV